jgi:hypothetical protein
MSEIAVHDFGAVDEKGDAFELHCDPAPGGLCRLEAVVQTERGPRRTEVAAIPAALWRKLSVRVVRELAAGMGEAERTRKSPTLKTGLNRLSPLLGRELAVLLWALMEDGAGERLEAFLHGWRELAREERWWLFARGSTPGQAPGIGWRRALFHGLSEPANSRAEAEVATEKKSPWIGSSGSPPRDPSPRTAPVSRPPEPPAAKRPGLRSDPRPSAAGAGRPHRTKTTARRRAAPRIN